MALLDQILGGVQTGAGVQPQKAGLKSTLAAGVLLALLVKAVRASQAGGGAPASPAAQPSGGTASQPGGLSGVLGSLAGALGGGQLGDALRGLGGAGALGALVNSFQQSGFGAQAGSWVTQDQNQPIAPHQVAAALGEDALAELQQHTGLGRESLLGELAQLLPKAISEATPLGRLPSEAELHRIAAAPGPA